jgi:alkyl hydroperoxide reductase subunit AhpC
VFIIGPDKKIKLILTYPASTGRNFAEILRVIDSLPHSRDSATPRCFPGGSGQRDNGSVRNKQLLARA